MSLHADSRDIEILFESVDDLWCLDAVCRRRPVAYVRSVRKADRLLLSDIKVDDAVPMPWPVLDEVRILLQIDCPTRSFRRLGIGTLLLTRLIAEAKERGIKEIWGSVTPSDIIASPHLLQWYRKFGFSVENPDGECLAGASWKISLTLSGAVGIGENLA